MNKIYILLYYFQTYSHITFKSIYFETFISTNYWWNLIIIIFYYNLILKIYRSLNEIIAKKYKYIFVQKQNEYIESIRSIRDEYKHA